jgi:hypothetical protein
MRLPRSLGAILAGLSFSALLGGWSAAALGADEGEAVMAASPPAMQQPAATEPSVTAETSAPAAEAVPGLLPPAPPPSLQTLLDQRRDRIRERREAMFDAYDRRDASMPPGWAAYADGRDRYRDAMRALYRQRRDHSRQHHNSWMDAFCPWSRPQRERSDLRSYLTQRDRLDRQERRGAFTYGQPRGFGAPIPR